MSYFHFELTFYSQYMLCEEMTSPEAEVVGVTCTIHGVCHRGCDDAGEPCACPELQHSASLEKVPLEQDVVSQEQGTTPHLGGDGQRMTDNVRLWRDPSGSWEVDETYPPACQHHPGVWPWCALDRMEIKRERATVKMGMDITQMRSMAICRHGGMGTGVEHLRSRRNSGCATSWEATSEHHAQAGAWAHSQ